MSDPRIDQVHAALDATGRLDDDEALRRALDADPELASLARDLERVDAALRGLGASRRSAAARQAFVARVVRATQAPRDPVEDPAAYLAAPVLDDPDEAAPPGPRAGADPVAPPRGGEFRLDRLGELATKPSEAPRPPRRPAPRPSDDRISIPKIARVLPPPPDLTLEPPPPAAPSTRPPPAGGGARWAIAAAMAALLAGGGAAAWWWLASPAETEVAAVAADTGDVADAPSEADAEGASADLDEGVPEDDGPEDAVAEDALEGDVEAPADAEGGEDEAAAARAEARRAARRSASGERSTSRDRPGASERTATKAPAPSGPLPASPSRDDVLRALRAVDPAVRACRQERTGVAEVRITVASSGRVRNAVVQGLFAGTPEGSCIARAVRGARFPAFRDEAFTVTYPFQL